MAKKKVTPKTSPEILTSTAQTIGSALGRLAVATGFERPAAKAAKKPAVKKAVVKKTVVKKAAVKKPAVKMAALGKVKKR